MVGRGGVGWLGLGVELLCEVAKEGEVIVGTVIAHHTTPHHTTHTAVCHDVFSCLIRHSSSFRLIHIRILRTKTYEVIWYGVMWDGVV